MKEYKYDVFYKGNGNVSIMNYGLFEKEHAFITHKPLDDSQYITERHELQRNRIIFRYAAREKDIVRSRLDKKIHAFKEMERKGII